MKIVPSKNDDNGLFFTEIEWWDNEGLLAPMYNNWYLVILEYS